MSQIKDWEQKHLRNLAETVWIEPSECRLLAHSFNWLCRHPMEEDDAYKYWVNNNWPDFVVEADAVEETIRSCANLLLKYAHGGNVSALSSLSLLRAAPPLFPGTVTNTMTVFSCQCLEWVMMKRRGALVFCVTSWSERLTISPSHYLDYADKIGQRKFGFWAPKKYCTGPGAALVDHGNT